METIILGLGSVLASWLFAWILWIIAEHEVRRHFSGLSKSPYHFDCQRSFTPMEAFASRLLAGRHQQEYSASATESFSIFVRPTWVSASGALVDLVFSLGAILVLVGSTRAADGLWGFFLLWYVASGCWLFIKDVLGGGEIGKLGYHLRFLVSAAVWPLILASRTAGVRSEN